MKANDSYCHLLGVYDVDLQHEVVWNLKQLRIVAVGLKQKGQDVEAALRSLPPLL